MINAQKDTTTVISYNIRYNNPNDGDNIWDNRKDCSVTMVKMERPDFLCVQEAYFVQLDYLLKNLPDYEYIGVGRVGSTWPYSITKHVTRWWNTATFG